MSGVDNEKASGMNVSKQARKALGVTLKRFAALIGRSPSIVWRREGDDKVSITPTAATLCNLIIEAVISGLDPKDVESAMDSVPEGERSEQAATNALFILCAANGRIGVVEKATGTKVKVTEPQMETEEEAPMTQRLRVMTNMIKDFEELGRKFPGPKGEYYRSAAADMARARYQAEQGIRAEEEEEQAKGGEGE